MLAIHSQLCVALLLLVVRTSAQEFTNTLTRARLWTDQEWDPGQHNETTAPYYQPENTTGPLNIRYVMCKAKNTVLGYGQLQIPLNYATSIWYLNGTLITNGYRGLTTHTTTGPINSKGDYVTTSSVSWQRSITSDLSGKYTCGIGRATKTFHLSVQAPAHIVDTTPETVALEGTAVTLGCNFKGGEPVSTTWFHKGSRVASFVAKNNTYTIRSASLTQTGNYTCTVSNAVSN
eukprot:scpid97066/ scgid18685/ 